MSPGQFVMHRSALAGVQAVAAHSRHAFARHTHEQFGIGVIRQGAQVSHSGRGQVQAGPGHVITVNPGEVHDGAPLGDGVRAWQMLYLDPEVVADAADALRAGGRAYEFEHPAQDHPALARDVLALYAQATAGAAPLACDALLLRILARAGAPLPDAGQRAPRAVPDAIRHARGLIDDDPAAALSLADLAAASGLSRYQVLRAFTRATGLTPHAYQVQRRLLLARSLIRGGTALAEAAAAGGFADQSHMTRLFVRAYGLSPGRYAQAAG
ncbi:AraC family transcriptional regulator [Achromobacter denitrificans]|uniref:AraC family transcriptional regulator n=1 Tax=Achromobacter denitrificans TaxID=32002 RepID=UPI00240D0407|nr:AraC family transcriptional regulator [Achromobacter denitrificans]MDX3878172.1 AraC family transcriptional regulator [Achromobacter sp.]WFC69323.1 AraC family transcriptional regulator [Achromobacter denitrificans]